MARAKISPNNTDIVAVLIRSGGGFGGPDSGGGYGGFGGHVEYDGSSGAGEYAGLSGGKKPTKLTLWEEFIDLYGNKLLTHLKKLQDFPVILARKVAKPKSSSSEAFQNRFSTTIQIGPPYSQAIELKTWYSKYTSFYEQKNGQMFHVQA
ncbi:hypothetical protein H5410_051844 [Solanum commersonii]|uniref:Uncharacterized protein n=1 Tax=Solanum commersonii TaxID=4109 RepID=A0A9J5WZ82_SOLCO|nr:hypothetical protein H5410_051844 [Solanum commersonii]